jgi:predicted dehydrogenase
VHVLLEKPIALSVAEADAVTAACADAGVLLMVGQTARFDAINMALRELVDDGAIGAPVLLSTFARHGWHWPGGWRAWQLDPAASGGHLVHNAVHEIDLACWLFGSEPARAHARGMHIASPELEIFDAYALQLSFASGATLLAELDCAAVPSSALLRSVHLIGSDGEARHDTTDDGSVWTGSDVKHVALALDGAIERELAHWLDCLEGRAEPAAGSRDATRALRIALAAERSARTGEVVQLDG